MMVTVVASIFLTIFPVAASFDTDIYDFHGKVIVASDDLHQPLEGDSVKIPETPATFHMYLTDISTSSAFPWKGYSSAGWRHGSVTTLKGEAFAGIETGWFSDDPDYWYFHLDTPKGYIPVSAHPLNAYGTALDSQTIYYNMDGTPVGDYDFLFQVKRDPGCLEPGFIADILPSTGDVPPQDVHFYPTYSKNKCTDVPIVDYEWKSYEWIFGDSETGHGSDVIHTYKEAREFFVRLTATADNGVEKTTSRIISIRQNAVKAIDSSPADLLHPRFTTYMPLTSPTPFQDVVFDAAASISESDPIAGYSWDFGDSATAQGRKVTHTYNDSGEYDVTLTIRTAIGLKSSKIQKVVVERGESSVNPLIQYLRPSSSPGGDLIPVPTPAPGFDGSGEIIRVNASSQLLPGFQGDLQYVDPSPPVQKALLPDSGSGAGTTIDINRLPCEDGQIRCNEICVDYRSSPQHCGSCNTICGPGLTCDNGTCKGGSSENIIGSWFDPILSLTQQFITVIWPAASPDTQGGMQGYETGPEDIHSSNAGEDSIKVVPLSGSGAIPAEDNGIGKNTDSEIVPSGAEAGDIQVKVSESPGIIPEPSLPPFMVMSLPTTGIVNEPVIVAPLSPPCPDGYYRCSDSCVDLMSNYSHCGACNSTCWPGTYCSEGLCIYPICNPGKADCDHNSKNGCETDISSDPNRCGGCGNVCPGGVACISGQCVGQMVTTQPTRLGDTGMRRF